MKALLIVFLLMAFAVSAQQIPTIESYVTDNADILSSQAESQIREKLEHLEQASGVQFAVYIENNHPKQYTLEEYSLQIAEKNRLGTKENDNGILLYIAVDEREFRWETGYGAEGTLNAALLGRISRTYMIPSFQQGNYEEGIVRAVGVVNDIVLNSEDEDVQKIIQGPNTNSAITIQLTLFIIFLIFLIIKLGLSNRKKGRSLPPYMYTGAATGIFKGGGGFRGGGGSFGGGGFSGRW